MRQYWFLLAVIGTLALSCSIPLGSPPQGTAISVRFDTGSRAVSPRFAAWTIAGTSADSSLALTTFNTKQGELKDLKPGDWSFNVQILDSTGAIIQTGSATAILVAGKTNTVTFPLDPVIGVNIGILQEPENQWTVNLSGDVQYWPTLQFPYALRFDAPEGLDSYTWYLDGELQDETGPSWESPAYPNNRFTTYGIHTMFLLVSVAGQVYSINFEFGTPPS